MRHKHTKEATVFSVGLHSAHFCPGLLLPALCTHSNLFKLDVWEVKSKLQIGGKSCSAQNPKLFFKIPTCEIFESYFFCCHLSFYGGSSVQKTKHGLLILEGFCSRLCFAKRCLCDLRQATSPKFHFLMWKSAADGFSWGFSEDIMK